MRCDSLFLSSDQVRKLTKAGGSHRQILRLIELKIPFEIDVYGTPLIRQDVIQSILIPADFYPLDRGAKLATEYFSSR
jgi:hypothetical protein